MAYNPQNPNGQTGSANSAPVVIASDQSALIVSQSVATNFKTQAENYQGGVVVSSTNPLFVSASGAVTVSQATAANLKTQAENYQNGIAVSSTNPLLVTAIATGSGGYSVTGSTLTNTVVNIGTPNTPGVVAGWYIYNSNSVVTYVQFFNTQASGVTIGTTTPVYSIGIPALSAANLMSPTGIAHSTAISIAATTTRAGSTAPGTAIDINIFYKQ